MSLFWAPAFPVGAQAGPPEGRRGIADSALVVWSTLATILTRRLSLYLRPRSARLAGLSLSTRAFAPVGAGGAHACATMSAELELAASDRTGRKLWSRFVEPPWAVHVVGKLVQLDVMGNKTEFPILGQQGRRLRLRPSRPANPGQNSHEPGPQAPSVAARADAQRAHLSFFGPG